MHTIFLSPSTQEWNEYVNGGNEEEAMNALADAMEPYLRSSGITFVRNDPARNVTGAIADSNSGSYDVHFALHSNAGGGEYAAKTRGIEIYYSPYSEHSRRLAVITANNFKEIYPLPEKTAAIPTTSLGEITQTSAPAVLCEIGYHDNPEDAEWIRSNTQNIACVLVISLCDYFGIPFVNAEEPYKGFVDAGGSNLNIRDLPSVKAAVTGSIPDGAELTVLGKTGGWYVVRYNGVTGYANAEFIQVINR